jgi:hypothetical protein
VTARGQRFDPPAWADGVYRRIDRDIVSPAILERLLRCAEWHLLPDDDERRRLLISIAAADSAIGGMRAGQRKTELQKKAALASALRRAANALKLAPPVLRLEVLAESGLTHGALRTQADALRRKSAGDHLIGAANQKQALIRYISHMVKRCSAINARRRDTLVAAFANAVLNRSINEEGEWPKGAVRATTLARSRRARGAAGKTAKK